MTSAPGISFDLRPSAALTRLLLVLVGLACIAPLGTSLPFYLRLPLSAGIGVFGVQRIRRFRQPPLRSLAWASDGVWSVADRRGVSFAAELMTSRVVGTTVCLQLRWAAGAGHVVLLKDNTGPDELRILRARLASAGGRPGPG